MPGRRQKRKCVKAPRSTPGANGVPNRIGEIQLTAAQEHLRQNTEKYWAVVTQGQRYDTGIPYGLMETQLALALNGVHRTEMCEAIARILATQVKS